MHSSSLQAVPWSQGIARSFDSVLGCLQNTVGTIGMGSPYSAVIRSVRSENGLTQFSAVNLISTALTPLSPCFAISARAQHCTRPATLDIGLRGLGDLHSIDAIVARSRSLEH